MKFSLTMSRTKTYHVTGQLSKILSTDKLLAKGFTNERHERSPSGEIMLSDYMAYIANAADDNLGSSAHFLADQKYSHDPKYVFLRRQVHIYFSSNPLYVLDKLRRRREENNRQNLPQSDIAILTLTLDNSEIRDCKGPHLMVTHEVPGIKTRIESICRTYREFILNYIGIMPAIQTSRTHFP
jgi:hypothetical protein